MNMDGVTRSMKKKKLLLPEDLLIQILLRLPVKSLVRFESVSTLWLSLISNPQFARSHFELGAARTHRIMFLDSCTSETQSIDLDASLHDRSASAKIEFSFPLPKDYIAVEILGTCRGLLLLWDRMGNLIYVWNPSTGVHRKLPLSPIASITNNLYMLFDSGFLYGFGYDPSTDDYLVILLSRVAAGPTQINFFSLRANLWGKIEGTHLPSIANLNDANAGSLLNGVIHWLALNRDGSDSVIIAFDLVERCFSYIPLPNDFGHHPTSDDSEDSEDDSVPYGLWIHGGFLSLYVRNGNCIDIWVMKQYKVQSSWTKTVSVPIVVPGGTLTRHFSPICSTESGDIFGMDGLEGLAKWNAKGELLEHQPRPFRYDLNDFSFIQTATYTETLFPPGDSGQGEDE